MRRLVGVPDANVSDPHTKAVGEINLFRGPRGTCMLIGMLRTLRMHAPKHEDANEIAKPENGITRCT